MATMRRDNIMQEMAREVNMLDHDNKSEAGKPVSARQKKAGMIAFWCVLGLIALIIMLFVIM